MASDDEDVPETGAVFTFGKTRFADNLASKFWIRDDPVVQISCGDEHSAIVTAKGKLYTFGSNDWGQLGHGNTKPYTKPSVVKKLKPEKVYLVACGRNHTLVATESGKLYSFGCGSDGQLGLGDSEGCHEPKAIESFDETKFKKLACGSDFSAAVTENGILYTWGGGSDGQNGLGEDAEAPQRLYISGKVVTVGCGYYHMAVVTDDGSLYTCGESTGGKLGLEQSRLDETSQLQKVESIKEKVTTVSCGAEFTVAVTENGHVYSFGQGNQGQLGLGSLQFETEQPEKVQTFNKIKAKSVSCGESFTAIITKHGNFYTFGDGRHGKLGLGDECFSNLFKPAKVSRFDKFVVNKVSCGGCHMLVTAIRKEGSIEDSDSEDQVEKEQNKTLKQGLMLDAVDGPRDLSATWSARDKRRHKNIEDINRNLSTSLPPVNKSSLPPLNGALKRTLQNLKTTNPDKEDKTTTNPLNMSLLPKITYPDDEDQKPVTNSPKPLPRGLPKPSPLAPPRALPRAKKEKEESEEEEEEESEDEDEEEDETENEKNRKNKKIQEIKKQVKKQDDEEDEEEDDETESEDETHTKEPSKDQRIIKPAQKAEDEEDEEEEESESEEENTNDASEDKKAVKSIPKKSVESEEDDEDEEEDEEAEEDENQNQTKKGRKKNKEESKKAKEKESKDKKIEEVANEKKKSKKDEEDEDEEEEEEEDDEGDGKKDKTNAKEDGKDKKNKKNKKKNKDDETEDNNIDAETKEKESKGKKGKKKKGEAEEDDKDQENTDDKKDGEKDEEEEETNGENKEDKNKDTNKPTTETPAKKDKKSGICVIL